MSPLLEPSPVTQTRSGLPLPAPAPCPLPPLCVLSVPALQALRSPRRQHNVLGCCLLLPASCCPPAAARQLRSFCTQTSKWITRTAAAAAHRRSFGAGWLYTAGSRGTPASSALPADNTNTSEVSTALATQPVHSRRPPPLNRPLMIKKKKSCGVLVFASVLPHKAASVCGGCGCLGSVQQRDRLRSQRRQHLLDGLRLHIHGRLGGRGGGHEGEVTWMG